MPERHFLNQRIVILGGSSGIGLAVAQQAAGQGATVIIGSSDPVRVAEAVSSLPAGQAQGQSVNLAGEAAIQAFFAGMEPFDHLVYTAGDGLQLTNIADTNLTQARQAFELRYWGALAAAKYAAPRIRQGGSIVLTTGIASKRPQRGWALGASVTAAVEGLTRALAVELAPIRVNAVSPGVVRTDLWKTIDADQRERMFADIGNGLLVGRVGEASEIAQAYLFFMRESFATGQTVIVDGGAVLV